MTRRDWTRDADRQRMRDRGTEADAELASAPPRLRKSKAVLRAELDAAMAAGVTRIVRCRCGHKARVCLPPDRLNAKLRCTRCGEVST